MAQELSLEINVEQLPKAWRNICVFAFRGCEDSKDSRTFFERNCANNGGDCYLLKEPEDSYSRT